MMKPSIEALRSKHRRSRREYSDDVLATHAKKLAANIENLQAYQSATHIAAYIAILGEISVEPVIRKGSEEGRHFYLPVLRGERMFFAPWQPDQDLIEKDFGLLEPECPETDWLEPEKLDLVLTPLVVFDDAGNRIGQGGGYYDRTFEFTLNTDKPVLMGVAHESQREMALDRQPWDVPLDIIVTEAATYRPRRV